MEISEARVLVVGATGALGGAIAKALHDRGARLAVTGRDPDRLATVGEELRAPTFELDVVDLERGAQRVGEAVQTLGGLDLLVVATGGPAFGPAVETEPAVTEEIFVDAVLAAVSDDAATEIAWDRKEGLVVR